VKFHPIFFTLSALAFSSGCSPAIAGPADYVYDPVVEAGEKEVDFKYGTTHLPDGSLTQGASIGFGYGATEHWFTEVYAKFARAGDERPKFDAFEWENRFQLTETGRYPVDLGFVTELEITRAPNDPNEFRFGPLLRTEFGRLQMNGNALFTKTFGANGGGKPLFGYQWQAKYRWQEALEVGAQGFGDLGPWNQWNPAEARSHQVGPALFGKLPLGHRQRLAYNGAWLFGMGGAAPAHTFRLQLEYEY
jgi:hypothetical protein